MQSITGLWTSGISGKLVIILAPLFVCCVSCVGLSLIVPPRTVQTPTPTAAVDSIETFIAGTANAISASNSSTPIPTFTNVPVITATLTPILVFATDTASPMPTETIIFVLPTPQAPSGCLADYPDFCIQPSPRLTCDELGRDNFTVLPPDSLGYDQDGDGVGCET